MMRTLAGTVSSGRTVTAREELGRTGTGMRLLLMFTSVIAVVFIGSYVGWDQIVNAISRADPGMLLLLFALQAATLLLSAAQLWYVLRCAGSAIRFSRVCSIHMAGGFVESITPSLKFGGEAFKAYLLKKETGVGATRLAGVLTTYGLVAGAPFVVIFAVAAAVTYVRVAAHLLPHTLAAVAMFGVAAWGLLVWHRMRRTCATRFMRPHGRIRRFLTESWPHARNTLNWQESAVAVLISLIIWLLYPAKLAIVAAGLGLDVPLVPLAAALYTSLLVGLLPLAPGGLGSFEASLVALLGGLGVAAAEGVTVVLVLRFATFWFPLLPSGYYAARVLLSDRGRLARGRFPWAGRTT